MGATIKTIDDLISDPRFKPLSLPDKNKMLMTFPEFSKLAPKDRMKVLALIEYGKPAASEGPKPAYGFSGGIKGLAEMLLPSETLSDYWKGPAYAATHPVESAKLLTGAIAKGSEAEAQAAHRDIMAGNEPQAALHVVGAIPVAGPPIASTIEHAASGQYARAAGNLAGLAAPFLVDKVLPSEATRPVRMTSADLAEGKLAPVSRMVQQLVEGSLPGSIPFERFRVAQQADLRAAADSMLNEIAAPGTSAQKIGEDVGKLTRDYLEREKARIGAGYREVDKEAAGTLKREPRLVTAQSRLVSESGEPLTYEKRVLVKTREGAALADTRPLKQFAVKQLRQLQDLQQFVDPKSFASIRSTLVSIIRAPKQATLAELHDISSEMIGVSRQMDELTGNKAQGIAKQVGRIARQQMDEAAANAPTPGLAEKIKALNAQWGDLMARQDRTFQAAVNLAKKNPDAMAQQLSSLPIQSVKDLKGALPKASWETLKRAWLEEGLKQATTNRALSAGILPRVGPLSEAKLGKEYAILDPKKFESWLGLQGRRSMLGDERLGVILDTKQRARIGALIADMRRATRSRSGIMMPVLNDALLWETGTALLTGNPAALAGYTGVSGLLYMIAAGMTSDRAWPLLRGFVRSAGNYKLAQWYGLRLANELNQESKQQIPVRLQ